MVRRVNIWFNEAGERVGGEKRPKPYFRFDARAAFDVAMVTG